MLANGLSEFQSPIGWGLSCDMGEKSAPRPPWPVSIPYWLGSKLRFGRERAEELLDRAFQSPIGWGLSCDLKWTMMPTTAETGCFNPLLVGV